MAGGCATPTSSAPPRLPCVAENTIRQIKSKLPQQPKRQRGATQGNEREPPSDAANREVEPRPQSSSDACGDREATRSSWPIEQTPNHAGGRTGASDPKTRDRLLPKWRKGKSRSSSSVVSPACVFARAWPISGLSWSMTWRIASATSGRPRVLHQPRNGEPFCSPSQRALTRAPHSRSGKRRLASTSMMNVSARIWRIATGSISARSGASRSRFNHSQ